MVRTSREMGISQLIMFHGERRDESEMKTARITFSFLAEASFLYELI